MSRSYFAILGVSKDASSDEIRSAYRRLVKMYHPDHFKGGNTPFMQIREAYAVLSDKHRRHEYQSALEASTKAATNRPGPGDSSTRGYRPTPPEPLVPEQRPASIFSRRTFKQALHTSTAYGEQITNRIRRGPARRKSVRPARTRNVVLEVPLTMLQARQGGSVQVTIPVLLSCSACNGMGAVDIFECARCVGQGSIAAEVPVRVSFPPGIYRAHAVKWPMERFGIPDLNLTIVFRANRENP